MDDICRRGNAQAIPNAEAILQMAQGIASVAEAMAMEYANVYNRAIAQREDVTSAEIEAANRAAAKQLNAAAKRTATNLNIPRNSGPAKEGWLWPTVTRTVGHRRPRGSGRGRPSRRFGRGSAGSWPARSARSSRRAGSEPGAIGFGGARRSAVEGNAALVLAGAAPLHP
jgi:hypothetical protein